MGGGAGGGDSVGIRRNPDGPTLYLEISVKSWNLRILDECGGLGGETDSVESGDIQTVRHSAWKSS